MVKLISVHVPKCAGTSFSEALKKAYGWNRIWFDNDDRPLDPASPMHLDPAGYRAGRPEVVEANTRGMDVVHGHFHPGKYACLGPDIPRITFLRHPVSRLISHYYFWLGSVRHGHTLHNYMLDNRLTVLEFAQLPLMRRLYTGVFFKDVDLARFDFVGACENLDADMAALGRLLGQTFEVERHNVTKTEGYEAQRRALLDDPAAMARLKDLLADDIRFYEAALARR